MKDKFLAFIDRHDALLMIFGIAAAGAVFLYILDAALRSTL